MSSIAGAPGPSSRPSTRDELLIMTPSSDRSSRNHPRSSTNCIQRCSLMGMTHLMERTTGPAVGREAPPPVVLDGAHLTIEDVVAVARHGATVELSTDGPVRQRIERARALRDEALARGAPIYGVTTGFGDSVHRQIAPARAAELQAHLVRNLGCGTGVFARPDVARATVLIRANSIARGHSGVRVALVERL